jgi:hypothetical protein
MMVCNEEEKIEVFSENETEVSKSDSVDGSLPVSTVFTDVGVVPEQQKNELEHFISNLQSMYTNKQVTKFISFIFILVFVELIM